jgi:cell division protease FtsH
MSNRNLWYFLAVAAGILLFQGLLGGWQRSTEVPYSSFVAYLEAGRLEQVTVGPGSVEATLKPAGDEPGGRIVATRVEGELAKLLLDKGVTFSGTPPDNLLSGLLSWLAPLLLMFGVWYFVLRRVMGQGGAGAGLLSIGKSRAKVYVESDTKVTFADVAGVDEAKSELQEIVNFLRDPKGYGRLGGRMPRGILLIGPPGTGKTLLARAVAGEAGVPFFSISGSEFVEMFVGVGAARVRDLFEQARAKAPAIIFIDELDALGRARGAYPFGGGHDEKEQTLNQLLAELDGFDTTRGVVLLGATNRPEILDPALLRAGRFDRQVLVDRPDRIGRVQILEVHLRKARLAADVRPEEIAGLTPGFTGADLANLVNEATLLATRRNAAAVTMEDFTQAIERIVAGLEKRNRLLNPLERKIIAWHEMGHALVALSLPGSDRVHKVSIIPRGVGALGYTIQRPTEDRFLMTKAELEAKMAVLLGGRAAESLAFGAFSTGAADDLAKATDIARSMVVRYGMDPTLGQVSYEGEPQGFVAVPGVGYAAPRRYSEETAQAIDRALLALVEQAFRRARELLEQRRAVLEAGVTQLLEEETLGEAALQALVAGTAPA